MTSISGSERYYTHVLAVVSLMNFIDLADSDAFLMYKSFKNIYQKTSCWEISIPVIWEVCNVESKITFIFNDSKINIWLWFIKREKRH